MMRVAHIVDRTEAAGPGWRFALWTQGCPLRCPGCCNPEMLGARGGVDLEIDTLARRMRAAGDIEGVSLLGGEPFAQPAACAELARRARDAQLSVVVFSGFTLAQLRANPDPAVAALLGRTDVLFAGPYERARPETRRRWIGSANQRTHHLTDRYAGDDPRFVAPNTIEIRLRGDALDINGWPAAAAAVATRRR